MNKKEFIKTYCFKCGSQRCEGVDSEWFDGCAKKWELKDLCHATPSSDKPVKIMYEGEQILVNIDNNTKIGFWEFGDEE